MNICGLGVRFTQDSENPFVFLGVKRSGSSPDDLGTRFFKQKSKHLFCLRETNDSLSTEGTLPVVLETAKRFPRKE